MEVVVGLLAFLCLTIGCARQDADDSGIPSVLYVAPDGDDNNPGTELRPLATLQRARDVVRTFKRKVPKPVTILVREGTYYLSEPLVFEPEDSGTELQPITYANYPGERPTISGGMRLEPEWEPYSDGIEKCRVQHGTDVDQLFIDGKRQVRARYPNFDPEKPRVTDGGYLEATGAGEAGFTYDPQTFTRKRWSKPTEAIVHIFPTSYWCNLQYRIEAIDWERHAVALGEGGWQTFRLHTPVDFGGASLGPGSRFFIENVLEELDAPGEWYLDKEDGLLYCKPPEGTDLSEATVEAGVLKRLVEFRGSRQRPVRHISLRGFRFAQIMSHP